VLAIERWLNSGICSWLLFLQPLTSRCCLIAVTNYVHFCLQEFKEVTRSKPQDTGITLIPNEANLFIWKALLKVR
jgi:hypothetical protein